MTIPKAKSRAHQAHSNSSNQQESYAWGRKTQGTKQHYTKNSSRPSQAPNKSRLDNSPSNSQGYNSGSEQTRNNARKRGNSENTPWSRPNNKFGGYGSNGYGGSNFGANNFGGSKNPEPRTTIWKDQNHSLTSHALRKANANQNRKGGFASNGSDTYQRKDMGADGASYKPRPSKRPLNKPQKSAYPVDNAPETEASESEREMIRRFKALMNPSSANKNAAAENTQSTQTIQSDHTASSTQTASLAQAEQNSQATPLANSAQSTHSTQDSRAPYAAHSNKSVLSDQASQAIHETLSAHASQIAAQASHHAQRAKHSAQIATDETASQKKEFNQAPSSKAERTKIPLSSNIPFTQTITVSGQGSLSSDNYLYDNEFSAKKPTNKNTEVKVMVKRRRVFQRVEDSSADDKQTLYETVTTTQTLDDDGQPIQISQAVIHNTASSAITPAHSEHNALQENEVAGEPNVSNHDQQVERGQNTLGQDAHKLSDFAREQDEHELSNFKHEQSALAQTDRTQQEVQDSSQQSLAAKIKRLGKAAARLSALEAADSANALDSSLEDPESASSSLQNLSAIDIAQTMGAAPIMENAPTIGSVPALDSALTISSTPAKHAVKSSVKPADDVTPEQDSSLEVASLGLGAHYLETTTLQTAAAPVSIKVKRRTKTAVVDTNTQEKQSAKRTEKQKTNSMLSAHTLATANSQSTVDPPLSLGVESLDVESSTAKPSSKSKLSSKKTQVKSSTTQTLSQPYTNITAKNASNVGTDDTSNVALDVDADGLSSVALDKASNIATEQTFDRKKFKGSDSFEDLANLDTSKSFDVNDGEQLTQATLETKSSEQQPKTTKVSTRRRTKSTKTQPSTVDTASDLELANSVTNDLGIGALPDFGSDISSTFGIDAQSDMSLDDEKLSYKSKTRKPRSAAKTRASSALKNTVSISTKQSKDALAVSPSSSAAHNETDLALSSEAELALPDIGSRSTLSDLFAYDSTLTPTVQAAPVTQIDAAANTLADMSQTATKKQPRKTSTKSAKTIAAREKIGTQPIEQSAEQLELTSTVAANIPSASVKSATTRRPSRTQTTAVRPSSLETTAEHSLPKQLKGKLKEGKGQGRNKGKTAAQAESVDELILSSAKSKNELGTYERAETLEQDDLAPTARTPSVKRRAKTSASKAQTVKVAKLDEHEPVTMSAADAFNMCDYGADNVECALLPERAELEAADGLILTPVVTVSPKTGLQSVRPHPRKLRLLKQDQSLSENALLSASAKIKAMSKPYVLID